MSRLTSKLRAFFEGLWQLTRSGLGGDARRKTDIFPHSDETSSREMDLDTVRQMASSSEPLSDGAWGAMLEAHATFLESGGTGGRWQMLSVSGLPMCVYTGAEGRRGEQAVLRLKNIEGIDGREAWLAWADLSGVFARSADFSSANLSHCAMIDSIFEDATFDGASLRGADLSGSVLTGATFRGADISHADFESCDCTGADFTGANLEGARFPGATLDDVQY